MTFHFPYRKGEQEAVRAAVTERANGLCERCGAPPRYQGLVLHHERYENPLTLDDMLLLCNPCHHTRHREPDAPTRPQDGTYRERLREVMKRAIGDRKLIDLAVKIGCDPSVLCRMRRQGRVPHRQMCHRIAERLELHGELRRDLFLACDYYPTDPEPAP